MVRLRRWLLVLALTLASGLAGLLVYGKYRARRFRAALPALLGADIRSETNGFTYSQSVKGRTLYTIHASKAIQHQNGKTILRDVDVTLYADPGTGRADRIRGAEFEYDQPHGVIRAAGEVRLDLMLPAPAGAASGALANRAMEITTSGVVFLEKLGVAATDKPLSFRYGTLSGSAVGAEYNADTGMLRLEHEVHVSDRSGRQARTLAASAAELDRRSRRAFLQQAELLTGTGKVTARTVRIVLDEEGSIQSLDGSGAVQLSDESGDTIDAPHLRAVIADGSSLRGVHLDGGVRYSGTGRKAVGAEADLLLDQAGQVQRLTVLHGVRMEQTEVKSGGSRVLAAERVMADLHADAGGHTYPTTAVATGGAKITSTGKGAAGSGAATTEIDADTLHATFAISDGHSVLRTLDGQGRTRIYEEDGKGSQRTSTADTLHVLSQIKTGAVGQSAIQQAVQQGTVRITEQRLAVSKAGGPSATTETHASAQRAEFRGDAQEVLLTGSPQLTSADSELAANTVRWSRERGSSSAEGEVRASYASAREAGKALQWTHVIADRAEVTNANQHIRFMGGGSGARMWNTDAQLEAPAIEVDRAASRLTAHSLQTSPKTRVSAVLVAAHADDKASRNSGPTRITSDELVWNGGTGQRPGEAVFTGNVQVAQSGAALTADSATAYFKGGQRSASSATTAPDVSRGGAASLLSGSLDRLLARGSVRLRQPGRTGRGELLTYTSGDGVFELAGTKTERPEIVDSTQGSLTGDTLRFRQGDESVEILGSAGSRLRGETHIKDPLGRSK